MSYDLNDVPNPSELACIGELPPDPMEGIRPEPSPDHSLYEIDLGSPTYIRFNQLNLEAPKEVWSVDTEDVIAAIRYDGHTYYLSAVFSTLARGVYGMTTNDQVAESWKDIESVQKLLSGGAA